MTVDAVTRRQHAAPFQPYWLKLADGREILVDHPDFVSVSEEDDSVTIIDKADGVEIVDLALIVSLRYGGRAQKLPTAR